MLFHTVLFGVFFAAVFSGHWLLHRWRMPRVLFLLAASYLFYMGWNAKYALLILFSTVLDYSIGLLLEETERPRLRRLLLTASIVGNLGVLAVFKYYDFFVESAAAVLAAAGWTVSLPTLRVLLPVGISFYTFQTLSYTLDIYYRRLRPTRNFLEFALFVSFFPQLVAGPIVRASQFLHQIAPTPKLTLEAFQSGMMLIFIGLLKKIAIADVLAETIVDQAFANPAHASGYHLLLATYGYAFQLYADFSGYSDIAIGAARLLGYELPINFDAPYRSRSITEFWRRWHITLSSFLRDYLYIPLGGNRHGVWRTRRNLLITLLLAGLWHGAGWTFVLFGLYHGLLLVFETFSRRRAGVFSGDDRGRAWEVGQLVQVAITFHLCCIGWIIFRAQHVVDIGLIFQRILTWAPAQSGFFVHERGLWVLIVAVICHYVPGSLAATVQNGWLKRCPVALQGACAALVLGFLATVYSSQHPFQYFQF